MQTRLRILNWNVEWAGSKSVRAKVLKERIAAIAPDVICLTESHADFFSHGFVTTSDPDYGYGDQGKRRKVVLWSTSPWQNVELAADHNLPGGRYVSASTETPLGSIRFIGVCIPWRDAHVRTGRKHRQPWEDHLQFVNTLKQLDTFRDPKRTLLLGDFNQTIPKTRAPQQVSKCLQEAIAEFECATSGDLHGAPSPSIDHICHSRDFICSSVSVESNMAANHIRLSDHFGVYADFRLSAVNQMSVLSIK